MFGFFVLGALIIIVCLYTVPIFGLLLMITPFLVILSIYLQEKFNKRMNKKMMLLF